MQNTSGILPSSSSAADTSPSNSEPQSTAVITSSATPATSSPDANTSSGRRIAVPRSQKAVHRSDDSATAVITPLQVAKTALVAMDEEPAKDSITAPTQGNKRRCWTCKSKISLSAVTCRCGYTFCNRHRYAEEHDCLFDFRQLAKRKLEEENPRVVPLKVARIN